MFKIGGHNGNGSGKGKGKGKEKEPVWDGLIFEVPGFHDEVFWDWKDVITASEMQILKRLGFQMQVSYLHGSCLASLVRATGAIDRLQMKRRVRGR